MKHDMTIEVTLNNASNRGRMVSMFAVKDTSEGLVPDIDKDGILMTSGSIVKAGDYKCTLEWNSQFQWILKVDALPY